MTDKEIIMIDGVNVNECKGYYFSPTGYHSCSSISQINELGYEQDTLCEQNPNCYFKQNARKTQIIDEIEEVIKSYQEQIELDALSLPIAIESILERKTQECEKYKQTFGEIYLIIDEIKEQYDILEISELEQIQNIINKVKDGNNE